MRPIVHILISLQIVGWAFALVVAGLGPSEALTLETMRGYLFLGFVSMVLCFIPAMRMSGSYEKQPISFMLAILPMLVLIGVIAINMSRAGA